MPSARYSREIPSRYRLEGSRCKKCGRGALPARKTCPACGGTDMEPAKFSDVGTVLTWTRLHVGAAFMSLDTPYGMAVVETEDGCRLTAPLAGADAADLRTGMKVRLVLRRITEEGSEGIICYGTKAVPA